MKKDDNAPFQHHPAGPSGWPLPQGILKSQKVKLLNRSLNLISHSVRRNTEKRKKERHLPDAPKAS